MRPNEAVALPWRGASTRRVQRVAGFLVGIALTGQLAAQSPDRSLERKQRLLKHAESLISGTLPSPQQLRPQSDLTERQPPTREEVPHSQPPIRRIQIAAHPRPPAEASERRQQLFNHAQPLITGDLPERRHQRSLQVQAENPPPSPPDTPSTQPDTPSSLPAIPTSQPPIRRIQLAAHPRPQPELPFGQAHCPTVETGPQPMRGAQETRRSRQAKPPTVNPSPEIAQPTPAHLAGDPGLIQEQSPPFTVEPPERFAPVTDGETPENVSAGDSDAVRSQEPDALPDEQPPALESVDGPKAMPWFGPGPAYASRPSLDIRPRYLEEEEEGGTSIGLVPAEELPADLSGLPTVPKQGQVLSSYAIDIRPVDICASARFMHKPLYYEDKYLERFGSAPGVLRHTDCARSGVHFLWSTATIPLHFWHVRPWECVSTDCLVRTQGCHH